MTLLVKDGSALSEKLVNDRVVVGSHSIQEFKGFMMPWLKTIQDIKQNSISRVNGLGWGERGGQPVFVAGQKIFRKDGGEEFFTHAESQLLNDYSPRGKKDVWEKCASVMLQDGRQASIATIMTAFTAPLMELTGTGGLTFCIYSSESGTGKSSLLKLSQAVWGHPIRGVHALDDTPLSLTKKLGFINSLPAYWDEVRGDKKAIHGIAKLIFQLAQGKEKSRLTSATRMQDMGTWKTLITMASNERINDHMDQIAGNSNAGRVRVFEITMPDLTSTFDGPTSNEFTRNVAALDGNYGHAGQLYAKYLMGNYDAIKKMVHTTHDEVAVELKVKPEERFWAGFVAAELSAARIVNDMGLMKFDIEPLKKWLYSEFYAQRGGSAAVFLPAADTAKDCLFQFIDAHRDSVLVVEHFGVQGDPNGYGSILVQPRDKEIKILKAHEDKKIRIRAQHFRKWMYEWRNYPPSPIFKELCKSGAVTIKKSSISAGLANTSGAQYECLEVDLNHPSMAKLLE
jgi:hypothetical protein